MDRNAIAEPDCQTTSYLDGTGNAGKNITGLAAAVPDARLPAPAAALTVQPGFLALGEVQRCDDGGAAVSAANIQQYMTALAIRLVRGRDRADLWVADNNYFQMYVNSLQAIQRVTSESGEAGAGFSSLKFFGGGQSADVVLDGGVYTGGAGGANWTGATANHMWALNTDYLFFRPHAERNFVPIGGDRQPQNQDAVIKLDRLCGQHDLQRSDAARRADRLGDIPCRIACNPFRRY